jgi:hypothetical protein
VSFQPRGCIWLAAEAVLAAWMILADGKRGAVALGARDQGGWLSNDQADGAATAR